MKPSRLTSASASASLLSLTSGLSGILLTAVVTSLLLFTLPDFSDAQSKPTPPQRSAPQDAAPMSGPTPPGPGGAPAQTPIDGGLGILLAAGGAYALRKMHKSKAE